MADSLDDFFAQKDKAKKSKGKKGTPIIPRSLNDPDSGQLEAPATKQESKRKDPILNVKIGDEVSLVVPKSFIYIDTNERISCFVLTEQEEGEWLDPEEEKDYTDLKIKSMTIKDKEEEIREQKLQEATEQLELKMNESGGPWRQNKTQKKIKESDESDTESKGDEDDTAKKEDTTAPKKYIPPSMRGREAGSSSSTSNPDASVPMKLSSLRSTRPSKAPEIQNQMEFPTLGADAAPAAVEEKHEWREASSRNTALKTENRFDGLKRTAHD